MNLSAEFAAGIGGSTFLRGLALPICRPSGSDFHFLAVALDAVNDEVVAFSGTLRSSSFSPPPCVGSILETSVEIGQVEWHRRTDAVAAGELCGRSPAGRGCCRRYFHGIASAMGEDEAQGFFADAFGDGVNGISGGDNDDTDFVFRK